MSSLSSLEQLLPSVEGKEEALEALLRTWRTTRSPEIADAIDAISDAITSTLPPITGKTRAQFQEAWLDIANENRATDLGRLLATLPTEPCTQIPDRLTRLEARDHDPRIARALWAIVGRCPCTSNPNFPWWTRLFKLLQETNDSRMRGPLEAKLKEKRQGGSFYDVLYPRIKKTLAGIEEPPPLSKEDRALVAAITKRALNSSDAAPKSKKPPPPSEKKQTEEELLALVYENPAADDPRLVYADFLLERGDVRGDFISLQFKRDKSAKEIDREKKLLKQHGRRWLGPLEPVIDRDPKAPFEFERGFLSSCRVAFKTKKQHALMNEAAWSTLRTLHEPPVELVTRPHLRLLESVKGLINDEAALLATHSSPLPNIRSISFSRGFLDEEMESAEAKQMLEKIGSATSLPNLTSIEVFLPTVSGREPPDGVPTDLGPLLTTAGTKLAGRLTHLSVVGHVAYWLFNAKRPYLARWLRFAEKSLPKIQSMSFDLQMEWALTVTRHPNEKKWDLELRRSAARPTIETLAPIFADVPKGTFGKIRVLPKSLPAINKVLEKITFT